MSKWRCKVLPSSEKVCNIYGEYIQCLVLFEVSDTHWGSWNTSLRIMGDDCLHRIRLWTSFGVIILQTTPTITALYQPTVLFFIHGLKICPSSQEIINNRIRIWTQVCVDTKLLCGKEGNDKTCPVCSGQPLCGVEIEVVKMFYSQTPFRYHLKMPSPNTQSVYDSVFKMSIHDHTWHLKIDLLTWTPPAFVTQFRVARWPSSLGVSVFLASWNLTQFSILSFDLRTHFSQPAH